MRTWTVPVFAFSLVISAGCGDDGGGGGGGGGGGPDGAVADVDGSPNPDRPDAGSNPDQPDARPGGTATFTRYTIDDDAPGPAYVTAADITGDGQLDLVVSHLGIISGFGVPNGQVTLHTRTGGLGDWSKSTIVGDTEDIKFPGHTTVADLDGDSDLDIVLPSGFLVCTAIPGGQPCGSLRWLEQTGSGWNHHELVELGSPLFYHHTELVDLDGDGRDDLITVGEEQAAPFGGGTTRAVTQVFAGVDGATPFATTPQEVGPGLGSFPNVLDLDGDGDLDIAGAEFFTGGSFGWYERTASGWDYHVIDDGKGPSIMMRFVPNLYGDGELHAIGANHTNTAKSPPDPWESAVYVFDIPSDPTQPWPSTKISTGIVSVPGSMFSPMAAPGIFGAGDMDDDGDIDVVVSGDGDPDVYWLEQTSPGTFSTHVLQADLPQAGGVLILDLDGDGGNETVITGYEDNVVYVFDPS